MTSEHETAAFGRDYCRAVKKNDLHVYRNDFRIFEVLKLLASQSPENEHELFSPNKGNAGKMMVCTHHIHLQWVSFGVVVYTFVSIRSEKTTYTINAWW